jgi:DNA-binding MarR family transcriptional regulator
MLQKRQVDNGGTSSPRDDTSTHVRGRGRPQGTTKPAEQKRQRVFLRLAPDIHSLIEERLAQNTDPTITTKTDFIEQAIKHYAQTLKNEHEDTQSDLIDHMLIEWEEARPDLRDQGNLLLLSFPIFARIERAAHFINKAMLRVVASYGLNLGEYHLLTALRRAGSTACRTPTELLHSLLITPGAISKQVDRLVTLGFVERQADPNSRRNVLICLSPRGREAIDAMINELNASDLVLIMQLAREERETLAHLLRKLLLLLEHRTAISDNIPSSNDDS